MPTYITLINYTQRGIEEIKDSPNRLQAAKEAIRAAGGELREFYLTMGRFDAISIGEAPNDEVYARTILALGAGGRIRTESLRAFTEDEFRSIVAGLP